MTLGLHCGTGASILGPLGYSVAFFDNFGVPLGSILAPMGSIWAPLGPILVTFSTLGRGPGPLWPLLGERLEKGTKNERKWEPK